MRPEPVSSGASIAICELDKAFALDRGSSLLVFKNMNIKVRQGTFLAILGPSGCGKSTLLRMIAGLENPTRGQIEINTDGQSRPRLGLMLQGYPTLPWLTVGGNVELAIRAVAGRVPEGTYAALATKYLSRVGLFGWQEAYPRELSGGMLQRVALARTLAIQPDLVLLDEPLGALDAMTRSELQILLRELHRTEGATFVIVTHDVGEALAVADRIIVLGSAGTGVLYDSDDTTTPMSREGLMKLLASTHVNFAAGTWNGYLPFVARLPTGGAAYRIAMGLSDAERIAALKEGRAAAAFFTIQALVERQHDLEELDAAVVHVFSQPTEASICEHILLSRRAHGTTVRWAVPGSGLETKLIARLDADPGTLPARIKVFGSRAACVEAVAHAQADACITDPKYADQVLGRWRRQINCRLKPLHEDVWRDLYTVLVAPRGAPTTVDGALARGLKSLTGDADKIRVELPSGIHYFSAAETATLVESHELDRVLERWGGSLFAARLAMPPTRTTV